MFRAAAEHVRYVVHVKHFGGCSFPPSVRAGHSFWGRQWTPSIQGLACPTGDPCRQSLHAVT